MTDTDPSRIRKRSVTLSGHRTSVSLEEAFWDALVRIAARDGRSINNLVADIDRNRTGNLSSALRIHVLQDLTNHAPASTGDENSPPSAGPAEISC